ncbi:hypothetical protein ACFZ8E_11535 [Methylobacterium sp. HMF5984]|uniref:hypothetical protein n=1 Tax=Methylobacterium sp. HMF5984 TaxID=3367370 RepID=UPI0038535CD2
MSAIVREGTPRFGSKDIQLVLQADDLTFELVKHRRGRVKSRVECSPDGAPDTTMATRVGLAVVNGSI